MALPLAPGLTPAEVGFLCEMSPVTVIPRQRLDGLELLGGPTQPLNPPFPTPLPLWLALLLKRQKRANISPPPWLSPENLTRILDLETDDLMTDMLSPPPDLPHHHPRSAVSLDEDEYLTPSTLEFSPPFLPNAATTRAQSDALPYCWMEMGHLLLTHAGEDFQDADTVRRLLRDLREVRMSKLRRGFRVLGPAGGVKLNGAGGMEVAEVRGFVGGVIDGLRRINRSREESTKEREAEERSAGGLGNGNYADDDEDDEMQL